MVGRVAGHCLCDEPQCVEAADQVDVDRAAEGFEAVRPIFADHAFAGRNTGAIDETVQRAECFHRSVYRLLHLFFVGDVRDHKARIGAEAGGKFFTGLWVEVCNHNSAAGRNQMLRGRRAQSRRAAGNQEYAVFDLHE